MKSGNPIIIFSMSLIILTSGCADKTDITDITESKYIQSLGNLCSGEAECETFCENNRGRCEEYCITNTNELCDIILTDRYSNNQINQNNMEQKSCVNNTNPVFTMPFTEHSKILSLSTLGGATFGNPGQSARSYVSMKRDKNGSDMIPVYAPTDSVLRVIVYANRNLGDYGVHGEYRLDFQASCEVAYTFDHLADVSDKIKDFAPKTPADTTGYKTAQGVEIRMPIKAGELVGYTNRNTIANNWDFMVQNTAMKKAFINSSRWVSQHTLYGTCPYDYFTDELKNYYYSLLSKIHSAQPDCGDTVKEIPGTIAGAWFQGDANENQGFRMSIRSDIHVIDVEIFRDNQRFDLRDTSGGRISPEDVKTGQEICYHDSTRNVFAFIKLVSETKIELASGNGSCPVVFPTEREAWIR